MKFSPLKAKYFLIALVFASGLYVFGNYAIAQYPGFDDPGAAQSGAASGGLVPVVPNVDGGEIPTGASAQVVMRFRNDGAQPVQTGLIRLYPSSTVSASVSLNQCEEEALPTGAECAIALSVKGLQPGSWRVEMLMSHSGRTRLVTATLSGTVAPTGDASQKIASDIEAVPDTLDFGALSSAQTLVRPITLRNITSVPIEIKSVRIDTSEQAGYTLKTECKKLDPGQACIAIVTWSPKLKGRSSGVIVVEHTGSTALTSIPLSGEYTPEAVVQAQVFPQAVPGKGLLVASQTDIDFGADVETASTLTVSLVNAGDADVTIGDIQISGADNGLSFKGAGCAAGTVLEPIEACPLTVTWSPTRVGTVFDDIQIMHDGARGVLVLPVRGEAIASVSQDQKAIVLSSAPIVIDATPAEPLDPDEPPPLPANAATTTRLAPTYSTGVVNPATVLDGYKITSFSPQRAIVNGPGGSRLVHDGEEIVLGGVPWFVVIQSNGIEFMHEGQRVLLLFDRSLSSINRVNASSGDDDDRNDGNNNSSNSSRNSSSNNNDSGSSSRSRSSPSSSSSSDSTPSRGSDDDDTNG